MKAEVLGIGCAKCNRLSDLVRKAIDDIGLPYSLEKVADISRMLELGPKVLPALAIDGLVVVAGHLPTLDEIKQMLIRCAELATTEGDGNSSSSGRFHSTAVGVVGGYEEQS